MRSVSLRRRRSGVGRRTASQPASTIVRPALAHRVVQRGPSLHRSTRPKRQTRKIQFGPNEKNPNPKMPQNNKLQFTVHRFIVDTK